MIEQIASWWRARTARERLLLQIMLALVFAVAAPLTAAQMAGRYRAEATADRVAAEDLLRQVEDIARARGEGPAPIVGDGTARGAALAIAQSLGLTITAAEPSGPDRLRLRFAPGDPLAMMRWMDQMARGGFAVSRTAITRQGETDLVEAQFEVGLGP